MKTPGPANGTRRRSAGRTPSGYWVGATDSRPIDGLIVGVVDGAGLAVDPGTWGELPPDGEQAARAAAREPVTRP